MSSPKVILPYKPDHPVMRPPSKAQAQAILRDYGLAELNRRMEVRNEAIRKEEEDPLTYGYEPPIWKLADLTWGWIQWAEFVADPKIPDEWKCDEVRALVTQRGAFVLLLGGNRAAKTTYMLKRLVQCTIKYAGGHFWAFHSTNDMSVVQHQPVVWHFLPHEWREAGKTRVAYVSYTQKNGFSDNRFVGPNGALVEFRNYEQDLKTLEGPELGDPARGTCLGYVADELAPVEYIETLKYRLATRQACGILGFTAVDGYTPTVGMALDGATLILDRIAPHLAKPERIPVLRRGANITTRILNFHSEWNPYGNFPELLRITANDPDGTRKVRLYGEPNKARETTFKRFSDKVHVKRREDFPKDLTWWMICDPGGARRKNMAMHWVGVDAFDRIWIYREWPCPRERIPGIGFPDPWAKPGKQKGHQYDGVPDDGCKSFGWTLNEYKEEIARLEGWDDYGTDKRIEDWSEAHGTKQPVQVRYIDSRFADTPSYTSTGNTTLLEEFASIGVYFEPTAGVTGSGRIQDGVDLIQDRLGYKEGWTNPHDGPRLFIAEECENTIFALKIWTGLDGTKGATKDWIDLLRYALMAQVCHIPAAGIRDVRRKIDSKARFLKPRNAT